jgi:hypothetical protein
MGSDPKAFSVWSTQANELWFSVNSCDKSSGFSFRQGEAAKK